MSAKRCTARESGGARCELPAGHDGEHACPQALAEFLAQRSKFRMVVISVALLLAGCGGAHYGAPYMALQAPYATRDVGAGPVEGRDCTFASALGMTRSVTVEQAMRDALEGTGASAIRDAEVALENGGLFEACIVVRGTPVVPR